MNPFQNSAVFGGRLLRKHYQKSREVKYRIVTFGIFAKSVQILILLHAKTDERNELGGSVLVVGLSGLNNDRAALASRPLDHYHPCYDNRDHHSRSSLRLAVWY